MNQQHSTIIVPTYLIRDNQQLYALLSLRTKEAYQHLREF